MSLTHRRLSLVRATPSLEDLGIDEDARALCVELTTPYMSLLNGRQQDRTGRLVYRLRKAEDRACPFAGVARFMVFLFGAGAPEAVVMRVELFIASIRRRLFSGAARRSRDELDRAEQDVESRENAITLEIRIQGETEELCLKAAALDEEEAAISLERAAHNRLRARELRLPSFPRPMGVPTLTLVEG